MFWYFSVTVNKPDNTWHQYFVPRSFTSIAEFIRLFSSVKVKAKTIFDAHEILMYVASKRMSMDSENFIAENGTALIRLVQMIYLSLTSDSSDRYNLNAYCSEHAQEIFFAFSGAMMRRVSKTQTNTIHRYTPLCSNTLCKELGANKCGGCMTFFYCSRDCQRQHRKEHKSTCRHISTISRDVRICENVFDYVHGQWLDLSSL